MIVTAGEVGTAIDNEGLLRQEPLADLFTALDVALAVHRIAGDGPGQAEVVRARASSAW